MPCNFCFDTIATLHLIPSMRNIGCAITFNGKALKSESHDSSKRSNLNGTILETQMSLAVPGNDLWVKTVWVEIPRLRLAEKEPLILGAG